MTPQFFNPESEEPETFISKLNFTKYLEARAKYYGFKIGKDYGEPFFYRRSRGAGFKLFF